MVSETLASSRQEYGVEYHETYTYDLLKEAGLSARTARPQHHEADPEEKAEFQETVEKKRPELTEKTVVVVDQFTKHVGTVQRRGFYPFGSNQTIEVATSWDSVTVLGAVADDGDSFFCWTEENLTRNHGIRLLEALTERFGEELVVFLDRAGYFYARDLWEHVSGDRTRPKLSETVRSRACAGTISKSGTSRQNSPN